MKNEEYERKIYLRKIDPNVLSLIHSQGVEMLYTKYVACKFREGPRGGRTERPPHLSDYGAAGSWKHRKRKSRKSRS